MLMLPNAEESIKGVLISSDMPIRQYCLSQLTALWRHISYNLGISYEDRSHLITRCMSKLYEVSTCLFYGWIKDTRCANIDCDMYEYGSGHNIGTVQR